MSFRHLESGKTGACAKQQPQLRFDQDTPFERDIKAWIQEMRESIRAAADHHERNRSRRGESSSGKCLLRAGELSQKVEQAFRDWTVHLAGEPAQRHRKKFSMEKLQKAYDQEFTRMKELEQRELTRPQVPEVVSAMINEETCLLDTQDELSAQEVARQDQIIQNTISQDREAGIIRITSQVSEVNQMYRDLASIVGQQGKCMDTIEEQARSSVKSTKDAVHHLKKASDFQKSSRERLCCVFAVLLMLSVMSILPHLPHVHQGGRPLDQANLRSVAAAPGIAFDGEAGAPILLDSKSLTSREISEHVDSKVGNSTPWMGISL
jgi:hypothetical protein